MQEQEEQVTEEQKLPELLEATLKQSSQTEHKSLEANEKDIVCHMFTYLAILLA